MKHRQRGRKLSRIRSQRKALIKTLLGSFILREKITTTEAKASEVRSVAEKLVTLAKKANKGKNAVAVLRELSKKLPVAAVKKLSGDFLKNFDSRQSGYVRIIKLGRRKGDSAKMAIIEFVK